MSEEERGCIKCGSPLQNQWSWWCREHYLEKEARYAIYDLTDTDHYKGQSQQTIDSLHRKAHERLINYAKYMMEIRRGNG